jgi:hypothetical protein
LPHSSPFPFQQATQRTQHSPLSLLVPSVFANTTTPPLSQLITPSTPPTNTPRVPTPNKP